MNLTHFLSAKCCSYESCAYMAICLLIIIPSSYIVGNKLGVFHPNCGRINLFHLRSIIAMSFPPTKTPSSKLNAVVFGGSGIAGQALVTQLASTPEFERIVLILRKNLPLPPPLFSRSSKNGEVNWTKFSIVMVPDVGNVQSYAHHLNGISVAFYAVGSKWKLVSREEFRRVEVDLVTQIGTGLKEMTGIKELHFLSATNTSPFSLNPISRIKAQAEGVLSGLEFSRLVIYRPGYFLVPNPETGKLSTGDWLMAELLDRWHWLSLDISVLSRAIVRTALGTDKGWNESYVKILEQMEIVQIGTLTHIK